MTIRKATPEDAPTIAPYILLAMEDIVYQFIGEHSLEKATAFLVDLIRQKATQYSYENCWLVEIETEIVAAAIVYNGADLHALREPVAQAIKTIFHKDFTPEDETQAGEYYIDSLAVSPAHQGQGIGTHLLQFLINEYAHKHHHPLALLVDDENPSAKKLYLRMGFKQVGRKTLAGKGMGHLRVNRFS